MEEATTLPQWKPKEHKGSVVNMSDVMEGVGMVGNEDGCMGMGIIPGIIDV